MEAEPQLKREFILHCRRVLIWSMATTVSGLFVLFSSAANDEGRRSLATMLIGWSVINVMLVWPSLRKSAKVPERSAFVEMIAFNIGLNFAYIGVGSTMLWLGDAAQKGFGAGIVVHGVGLQILDTWLRLRLIQR